MRRLHPFEPRWFKKVPESDFSAAALLVGGHAVARPVEGFDYVIDRHFLIVKLHGHGVGTHVRFHGVDIFQLLDGRTGPRRGAASDDAGCLEDVGHGLGSPERGETAKEGDGEQEA